MVVKKLQKFLQSITLRRLRIIVLVFAVVSASVMAAYYGTAFNSWTHRKTFLGFKVPTLQEPFRFEWREYVNCITAALIIIIYIIALVAHYPLNKFVRAGLVAVPVALSLYINIDYLVDILTVESKVKTIESVMGCVVGSTKVCRLNWASRICTVVVGAFAIVEIGWSLGWRKQMGMEKNDVERGVEGARG